MNRYINSEKLLEKSLKVIPLGTQTFSKSKTQYPFGVSPFFINKSKGSRVWDVDGNEYIDFVSSLCSITLGYNDSDINEAVLEQLKEGIIFSLPHPVEIQASEKIIEMVPCAEMVRFGKNGSDATSGATRLARAYTKRDKIAVCGYHGWQDWYIASTSKNLGVPEAVKKLTLKFNYNDIDSLHNLFKENPGQISCVIMEAMNVIEPKDDFLHKVKEITHKNGALFILDETITGFRYANGGAQEYFGIEPDLCTLGKGLANGYPLSAIAGKSKYMHLLEEVFFSFTFGGEALSLAACIAVLNKLQNKPVLNYIFENGILLINEINDLIKDFKLEDYFSISGHPSWSFLNIKEQKKYTNSQIKALFLQEMFKNNILTLTSHNLTYSHSKDDIETLLGVYREVLPRIADVIKNKKLETVLNCTPLEPLFKVR